MDNRFRPNRWYVVQHREERKFQFSKWNKCRNNRVRTICFYLRNCYWKFKTVVTASIEMPMLEMYRNKDKTTIRQFAMSSHKCETWTKSRNKSSVDLVSCFLAQYVSLAAVWLLWTTRRPKTSIIYRSLLQSNAKCWIIRKLLIFS